MSAQRLDPDAQDEDVSVADAVVIGAGPNGLVAANLLADAGWDTVVLEANDEPGGAVRTAEITAPGFRNDLFSAFYPMTAASAVMRSLRLEDEGLRWSHAPTVLAHLRANGPPAILHRDIERTAASLVRDSLGDGARYRRIVERWMRLSDPLMEALLSPFPPVRASLRLLAAARSDGARDLARLAVMPLRRFVEEEFRGSAGRLLFAGNALHADVTPESTGSAVFGWLLVCLGQQYGFPVPVGGAGQITAALVARAARRGVHIECGARVDEVVVREGRAVGVVTADSRSVSARRAVLADCDVARLLIGMVGESHLPADVVRRLHRVQRGFGTFKVDWAVDGRVPWADAGVAEAGTVHIADSLDELTMTSAQLSMGRVPSDPFLLVGQMTTADPTRSPAGTETLWAYTRVPQAVVADAGGEGVGPTWSESDCERFADRMQARIERLAPGFGSLVTARHIMSPIDLERADANLVGGDLNGGTAQPHQQLVFRPVPGLARAETAIRGLYLASASAHPGGAVHGACGANAARAAILHDRLRHPIVHIAKTRAAAKRAPASSPSPSTVASSSSGSMRRATRRQ
ncbi:MAG: phytoene desaturase family protein [Acidimicrobiia bacterium]